MVVGCVAGCTKNNRSGVFVAQSAIGGVDMLNVVEAPAGHLSGTFTASFIDSKGDKQEESYNTSGSIYKDAFSLRFSNNPFFGTNVVGTMSDNEINLSFAGKTETFEKMTNQQYADVLASHWITKTQEYYMDHPDEIASDLSECRKLGINTYNCNQAPLALYQLKHKPPQTP